MLHEPQMWSLAVVQIQTCRHAQWSLQYHERIVLYSSIERVRYEARIMPLYYKTNQEGLNGLWLIEEE